MGRVLSVVDRRLQRLVALKQIAIEVRERPGMDQRFAREAFITAALEHPAIVPIFDAGEQPDGGMYYTMRLIRGHTLTAALQAADGLAGRLGLLRHFLVACEAVAYAHSQGVIHRDLKPDNILVGEFGETQIVDWGLARRSDEAEGDFTGAASPDAAYTIAGTVVGTPAYMSPEQARGETADSRSDIWSLGVILYELIAGVPPIRRENTDEVLAAVRAAEIPSLSAKQPAAPKELVAIVERALHAEPSARYVSARAMAADIGHFLDGRRVTAYRYSLWQELLRRARPFRTPLLVAAAFSVLLLVLAIWAFWRTGQQRDLAVAAERRTREALVSADDSLAQALTEQALAAHAADAQPEAEVLAAHALVRGDSPDARGVLASFGFSVRPRLIGRSDLPPCRVTRVRSDGHLLCLQEKAVSVFAGQPLQLLWSLDLQAQDATWMEDGQRIALTDVMARNFLLNANDGSVDSQPGSQPMPAGWLESEASRTAVFFTVDGLSLVTRDLPATSWVQPCGKGLNHLAASLGRRRQRIAVLCKEGRIAILSARGEMLRWIETEFRGDRAVLIGLAMSPDETQLVLSSAEGDVYTFDLESNRRMLHRRLNVGILQRVVFAPDSQRVLIIGDRGGSVVWQTRSGSIIRRLPASRDQSAAWSPDGRELFVVGDQLRHWSLPPELPPLRLVEPVLPGLAGAAISPTKDRLALARGDGSLEVLDTASGALLFRDRFQQGVLKGVQFLSGGTEIVAWAAGRPALRRYDASGRILQTQELVPLRRVIKLPGGWLFTLTASGAPWAYGPGGDREKHQIPVKRLIIDAAEAADGRAVVLIDDGGQVLKIEDGSPPRLRPLVKHSGASVVALSSDGARIVTADSQQAEVRDLSTLSLVRTVAIEGSRIQDAALSPDGEWLATGDLSGVTRVYSLRDGRCRATLHGHNGRVSQVSFSADGSLLVTASWDGSARLWSMRVLAQDPGELVTKVEAEWGLDLSTVQRASFR